MARATKKKAPRVSRKSSVTAEERHIGSETTDWTNVINLDEKINETMRHYGYFYDYKEGCKWVIAWLRKNGTKDQVRQFQAAEAWRMSMTASSLLKMHLNGAPLGAKRLTWAKTKLAEVLEAGKKNLQEKALEPVVNIVRKTPAEIIKEKTSDFIAEIEAVIDDWHRGIYLDIDNYSVYNELKLIDAPSNIAKAVVEYYTPLKEEIEELITKKTPDLVEGYGNMTLRKKKEYLKLITVIIDDAERYLQSKKAVRKTRVAKPKTSTQQVAKVKYAKENTEHKLVSIDPASIIGAEVVWLFNVKYKTLIKASTQKAEGFTVKGTTLLGLDPDNTSKKKLRKPDEFLKQFISATKVKSAKMYGELTTKPSDFTGRLGEDTIILKVY